MLTTEILNTKLLNYFASIQCTERLSANGGGCCCEVATGQNQHVPSQFRTRPDRPRLFPCPLQRRPTKSGKLNARAVLRINCQAVSTSASPIKIKINCVHSYPVGGGALAQSASTEGSEENCDEKLSSLENLARLLFAA
jgi:hypothetical protein